MDDDSLAMFDNGIYSITPNMNLCFIGVPSVAKTSIREEIIGHGWNMDRTGMIKIATSKFG